MLSRLTAEESLVTRERLAVGTGSLSQQDAQRIVADWIRQVQPQHAGRKPKNIATMDALAAMGIAVISHG
jgi:polyhydroxyalkanoate synthesis regulator phasin